MTRTGASAIVDALTTAGVEIAFGVPGIHGLALWNELAQSDIRFVGLRTELGSGFAADGYARAGRRVGVLLTTTGPGAMVSTAALLESSLSFVPVVNIVTQIPTDLLGQGRGALHENSVQTPALAAIAKWHRLVERVDELEQTVHDAVGHALTAPQGPAVVEVPFDLLTQSVAHARLESVPSSMAIPLPPSEELAEAARILGAADRPVVWAGGGVSRSGASAEFVAIAEALDAPAATTFMGKGSVPASHPLAVGSGCREAAFIELLIDADVVLAVGTKLGAETTDQWNLTLSNLIHIDARPEQIGRTYPALGLPGDAGATLGALLDLLPDRRSRGGAARAQAVRERIAAGLEAQPERAPDLGLIRDLRRSLPNNAIVVFDMTIAGYMASWHFDVHEPDTFLYPFGSATLGYAWPAAIGAKLACPDREVVAIHGDGGVLYSIVELLSAAQHEVPARLVVIDDGGYGILRIIQQFGYERTFAVDLNGPDFAMLATAMGVEVIEVEPGSLSSALDRASMIDAPVLIHIAQVLQLPNATD